MSIAGKRIHTRVLPRLPLGPLGTTLLLAVVGAVAAVLVAAVVYQISFVDKIFPGVVAQGVNVGGLARQEAELAILETVEEQLSFPVTLRHRDTEWTLSARELGASVDVQQLAAQAYAVGRDDGFPSNLVQQYAALRRRVSVGASVRFDSGPTNVFLAQIAQSIDRPARNARIDVQQDLSVVTIPAETGIVLDRDATRRLIQASILAHAETPLEIATQETLPVVTETNTAVRTLRTMLKQPLTIELPLDNVLVEGIVTPQDLKDMSTFVEEVREDDIGTVTVWPDEARWQAYLEDISQQVERHPVDARFEIDSDTNTVAVLRPSQVGYQLDVSQALWMVKEYYKQPTDRLQLPVTIIEPAVPMHAVDTMGFENLIVEATTYFKGSSDARVHNIEVAAAKFHGVVVPPGEIFSFNEHLGDVTAANGFEESLIIWGDRTDVGIGGGVCQVSTTAFRAALFGGFDIVERWAHGYRVGWYETKSGPGLDATIYVPDVDFRFRNDTDGFLLIQTEVDSVDGAITFRFYGPPTGREVVVGEPVEENVTLPGEPTYQDDSALPKGQVKQIEWEKEGVDVTVTRLVELDGQALHTDTFVSHYRPWQAVFLVGTGSEDDVQEEED